MSFPSRALRCACASGWKRRLFPATTLFLLAATLGSGAPAGAAPDDDALDPFALLQTDAKTNDAKLVTDTPAYGITLSGTVRGPDGTPVPDALVVVMQSLPGVPLPPVTTRTGGNGKFSLQASLSAFAPEPWTFSALVYARGLALASTELMPGSNSIALARGRNIAGRVTMPESDDDPAGPAIGARVRLKSLVLGRIMLGGPARKIVSLETLPRDNPLRRAFEVKTGKNGEWSLPDVPLVSEATVVLDDPQFALVTQNITVPAPAEAPGELPPPAIPAAQATAPILAQPGALLSGRLGYGDGTPAKGVMVSANVPGIASSQTSGRTSDDGSWALWGLPPGKARLQVAAAGPDWVPTGVEAVPLAAGGEVQVPTLTLTSGVALAGAIRDAETGRPIVGVQVQAKSQYGTTLSTSSDAQGKYEIHVPLGTNAFSLLTFPLGFLEVPDPDAETEGNITPTDTKAPTFQLRVGTSVEGEAYDENGNAATGALLRVSSRSGSVYARVDARGNWTAQGLDTSRKLDVRGNLETNAGTLRLEALGLWAVVNDGQLQANDTGPVQLTLRRLTPKDVTVRVVNADGAALPDITVALSTFPVPRSDTFPSLPDPVAPKTTPLPARLQTNARGEVVVPGVSPGQIVRLVPQKDGFGVLVEGRVVFPAPSAKAATAPLVTDAKLARLNATLRGQVVNEKGEPVARSRVLARAFTNANAAPLITDADGRFTLSNLPAGELWVGAAQGRAWGTQRTQASDGAEASARIVLRNAEVSPENDSESAFALLDAWTRDVAAPAKTQEIRLDETDKTATDKVASADLKAALARLAPTDPDRALAIATRLGDNARREFLLQALPLVARHDPTRGGMWADIHLDDLPQDGRQQLTTLQVASATLDSAPERARLMYDRVARTIGASRSIVPDSSFAHYALLLGLSGALHAGEETKWQKLIEVAMLRVEVARQSEQYATCAALIAQSDGATAEKFIAGLKESMQGRALQSVIPVLARTEPARALRLAQQLDTLAVVKSVTEAKPTNGSNTQASDAAARLSETRLQLAFQLVETNPAGAVAQMQKVPAAQWPQNLSALVSIAGRLPDEQAIPILRAAFEAIQKASKDEGATTRVQAQAFTPPPISWKRSEDIFRLAAALGRLDAAQGEACFAFGREKLPGTPDQWRLNTLTAYAFYRADSDASESRVLLEGEWRRQLEAFAKRDPKQLVSSAGEDTAEIPAPGLWVLAWAMTPLDFERAGAMEREALAAGLAFDSDSLRVHQLAWLLGNAKDRGRIAYGVSYGS